MRVAISGASGLIGSALRAALEQDGHTVQPLVRRPTGDPNEIQWQPQKGTIDSEKLVGTHAVVHLAGEPIIGVRWTEQKKQRVLDSRVLGTRLIAQTLGHLDQGPRVLISASAIGF